MAEKTALRARAIAKLEEMLAWLRDDEPLVVAGWELARLALELMGKKTR